MADKEPNEVAYKVIDHRYEDTDQETEQWREEVYFDCGNCGETIIDMDEPFVKYERCPHCNALIDWDGWV